MKTPSLRDVEQLSACLDGQLSLAELARLNSRLETDPNLSAALEDLRATRALLRRTAQRHTPRNFTLTPKMAGLKPPLPRAVPVFRLASVVASILLFFTFAGNLLAPLAAAPKMAAAPLDMEARAAEKAPAPFAAENLALSPTPESMTAEGLLGGGASKPLSPTPESMTLLAPQATPVPGARTLEQPSPSTEILPTPAFKLSRLQIALLALAVILAGSAFLIRWQTYRAFAKKVKGETENVKRKT
ncbi:MAG: hypothetical protein KJ606_08145 [Chloroflexi bacterium]|nr:hypothetical protein [Chloroflexota bacterium]